MLGQNLLHLSQSLSGKELICWIKTVVLCNFLSAAMRACSCSFVTMAASVRSKLKLGISECRCLRLTNLAQVRLLSVGSISYS